MFCTKCGANLPDDSKFCTVCGAGAGNGSPEPVPPADGLRQAASPAQPPYAAPQPGYAVQPAYAPPPVHRPKKKRHVGCLVFLIIFLVAAAALMYVVASIFWLPPRDLGIHYTQANFDSAMQKIGLQVDFEGKSSDEITALIAEYRKKKVPIDQFNWFFTNYEERSFELTPEEVTAFINEIAPPFSWFENVQVKVLPDGRTAGSYKVRFDKIKDELIPDIVDSIPPEIGKYLPDTFNLYMEGSFEIVENEVSVPEKLDRLDVGTVAMQPVIKSVFGELSEPDRAGVFDYAERIYKKIPNLVIHSLKINDEGNYEISAYMPTKVTVTAK